MKQKIRESIQGDVYAIKLLFESSPPLALAYTLGNFIDYPLVLFGTYLWKLIIDRITSVYNQSNEVSELWILLGIYVGIRLLNNTVSKITYGVVRPEIESRSRKILDLRIMRKMAALDADFLDDPANRDTIQIANTSKDRISRAMTFLVRQLIYTVTFSAGLAMFISISPIVGTVYLATALPNIVIDYKSRNRMDQYSISSVPETRRKNYYRSILTGKEYAQELRVYGLSGYFKEKYNDLWNRIREARYAIFQKGTRLSYLSRLISSLGDTFLIIYSVYEVFHGSFTVGTLSMMVSLSGTVKNRFIILLKEIPDHYRTTVPRINRFRQFMEYENKIKSNGTHSIQSVPDMEFRDVCFRYPGTDKNVLDHLNLHIPSGKKIGLVGLNGAGKTTITKLLLRFYEPQSGQILLNGRDIADYALQDIHRLFSICFQDVVGYSMTVKENIALSDIEHLERDADIRAAAVASGADKIYEHFVGGLDAKLTRRFDEDGHALSGGQWQKIALARAFFRDSRFIMLDEPSSALDPEAEDFIFSSFQQICKNKGGILISHRLSAIMMVDDVVLLKDGKICEQGSHAELMARDGEYASLYRMQAEKYVTAGGGIG